MLPGAPGQVRGEGFSPLGQAAGADQVALTAGLLRLVDEGADALDSGAPGRFGADLSQRLLGSGKRLVDAPLKCLFLFRREQRAKRRGGRSGAGRSGFCGRSIFARAVAWGRSRNGPNPTA